MIKLVENKKEVHLFVDFIKKLYKNEKNQVFPLFSSLYKDIESVTLIEQSYKALLCLDEKNEIQGRILYNYYYDKSKNKTICFYSYFDLYNNIHVAKELFDYVFEDMRKNNINYIEGTYSPFDPDTRRGILSEGFSERQTLFNSYNYEYYNTLLQELGFTVQHKSLSVLVDLQNIQLDDYLPKGLMDYYNKTLMIRHANFDNIEADVNAVCEIMEKATTSANYQEPPSRAMVKNLFEKMKPYLDEELLLLAFEKKTGKPIGFTFAFKDYNQILQYTKGTLSLTSYLLNKNKIDTAIGKLQYIVPKYQGKGLIVYFYKIGIQECKKMNLRYLEGGTIFEENQRSYNIFLKLGGKINKRYSLYGKSI